MSENNGVSGYIKKAIDKLRVIYPTKVDIESRRRVNLGEDMYSPRLDIAVAPYLDVQQYDRMISDSKQFIQNLVECHKENLNNNVKSVDVEGFKRFNQNARCLLAIEIEDKTSKKHMLGAIINASVLGRIGVLVAWKEEKLDAFIRHVKYLKFISSNKMVLPDLDNILILEKEQFLECCGKCAT